MFYAVAKGRKTGVFTTWGEVKLYVDGFEGARFKKFATRKEAEQFIQCNGSPILGQFGITTANTTAPTSYIASTHVVDEMPTDSLIAFTDGACSNNGRRDAKAGYAVVFPNHQDYSCSGRVYDHPTNNRAEYMALVRALEVAKEIDPTFSKKLVVYTDSKLLLQSITKWMRTWKLNNWRKADGNLVLNRDLLEQIDSLIAPRKIEMHHVYAHTGKNDWKSIWNDQVDKMAQATIR